MNTRKLFATTGAKNLQNPDLGGSWRNIGKMLASLEVEIAQLDALVRNSSSSYPTMLSFYLVVLQHLSKISAEDLTKYSPSFIEKMVRLTIAEWISSGLDSVLEDVTGKEKTLRSFQISALLSEKNYGTQLEALTKDLSWVTKTLISASEHPLSEQSLKELRASIRETLLSKKPSETTVKSTRCPENISSRKTTEDGIAHYD